MRGILLLVLSYLVSIHLMGLMAGSPHPHRHQHRHPDCDHHQRRLRVGFIGLYSAGRGQLLLLHRLRKMLSLWGNPVEVLRGLPSAI